jgi:hypothetical protein
VHIDKLGENLNSEDVESQSDIKAISRSELNRLQRNIDAALPGYGRASMERAHLEDASARIDSILDIE